MCKINPTDSNSLSDHSAAATTTTVPRTQGSRLHFRNSFQVNFNFLTYDNYEGGTLTNWFNSIGSVRTNEIIVALSIETNWKLPLKGDLYK